MASRIIWVQANGFCGRCGAPTVPIEAGAKRCCTKDKKHRLYPRTDPVVCLCALLSRPVLIGIASGITCGWIPHDACVSRMP